jgi:carbonic anhydrase/acetyltransferase-like protein (isoleucine patch superfamily)
MDHSIRSHDGTYPSLSQGVFIDQAATVIGMVSLGEDVSVWPGAVIRGDMHSISVGARSNIQDNAVLHITHSSAFNPDGWPLQIGEDVVVGHSAILHGCNIGSRVLVGNGAIINDGVVVENEVIIGSGCLVPPGKTLESGYVYVGNPCKKLREITASEKRFFTYSAANYVKLKNKYLAQRSNS